MRDGNRAYNDNNHVFAKKGRQKSNNDKNGNGHDISSLVKMDDVIDTNYENKI